MPTYYVRADDRRITRLMTRDEAEAIADNLRSSGYPGVVMVEQVEE